ncbi:MAG: alginate export family protein [Nitrococcus mobilis]|nr:alginate export family protein [Nitrococcus mobilis]
MAKFKVLTMGALGALGAAALLSGSAQAEVGPPRERAQYSGTNLLDAVTGGDVYLELRPRYEFVSDDSPKRAGSGSLEDANAFTLRSVLGYETGRYYGFGGFWKILNVSHISNDFNDGVGNADSRRATVVDPETTQTQEAFLSYKAPEGVYGTGLDYLTNLELRFGRQAITLQNHRWVGNIVWRQTWLVYDGFSANYTLPYGGHLFYSYIYNANTAATTNSPNGDLGLDGHIINAEFALDRWTGAPTTLTGYGYLFDYDNNQGAVEVTGDLFDQASSRASNKTFGVRLAGEYPFAPGRGPQALKLVYTGEYANQSDYANGSGVVDANYIYGRLGFEWSGVQLTGNYEILGSNNGKYALHTQFATAFAMNGWADRIPNNTPATGLVDAWIEAKAAAPASWGPALSGTTLYARFHDFSSDAQSIHYGREFDLRLTKQLTEQLGLLVQYAAYWGDSEATAAAVGPGPNFNLDQDIQKAWVMATYKF